MKKSIIIYISLAVAMFLIARDSDFSGNNDWNFEGEVNSSGDRFNFERVDDRTPMEIVGTDASQTLCEVTDTHWFATPRRLRGHTHPDKWLTSDGWSKLYTKPPGMDAVTNYGIDPETNRPIRPSARDVQFFADHAVNDSGKVFKLRVAIVDLYVIEFLEWKKDKPCKGVF